MGPVFTTQGTVFMPNTFRIVCGSLTSHIELINMEGIVRRDLRFIVLIREDEVFSLEEILHCIMEGKREPKKN